MQKPNVYGKDRFILALNNASTGPGIPNKVFLFGNRPAGDPWCPSGNNGHCYYTSWITGTK